MVSVFSSSRLLCAHDKAAPFNCPWNLTKMACWVIMPPTACIQSLKAPTNALASFPGKKTVKVSFNVRSGASSGPFLLGIDGLRVFGDDDILRLLAPVSSDVPYCLRVVFDVDVRHCLRDCVADLDTSVGHVGLGHCYFLDLISAGASFLRCFRPRHHCCPASLGRLGPLAADNESCLRFHD